MPLPPVRAPTMRALVFAMSAPFVGLMADPAAAQLGPAPGLPAQSLNQPNGPAKLDATGSANAFVVLGRSLAARNLDRINIKDAPYNAALDGVTDDSAAWAAAITRANTAMAAGYFPCIYMPAGTSFVAATTLPTFRGPGCIIGDGPAKSFVTMGTGYTGDLFSWSEAWMHGNYPQQSGATLATVQAANPIISNLAITGNTSAPGQQNAIVFYDRNDFALVRDVNVSSINGRAIYAGVSKYIPNQAYMRESVFDNVRIFTAGGPNIPAVEFSTVAGSADSTNEIDIVNMNIFAPNGPGMVIRGAAGAQVRNFVVHGLRIEGANAPAPAIIGILLTIGDPVMGGVVANLNFYGLELINPYAASYALETTAPSAALMPYNIKFDGLIGTGLGKGIGVTAGRSLSFRLSGVATTGTNVTIGSSALVGTNIEFDGNGAEKNWTYVVDPTSAASLLSPLRNFGTPSVASIVGYVGAVLPVAAGTNAVDLQLLRSNTAHTASGPQSVVSGGESNKATNTDAIVTGGAQNSAQGYRSTVLCGAFNLSFGQYSVSCGLGNVADGNSAYAFGTNAVTRTTNGKFAYSGGDFTTPGDAQLGWVQLRAAPATIAATRLTSDGVAPNANNVVNAPVAGTLYHLRVSATCRDTTNSDWAGWTSADAWLNRPGTGNLVYTGAYSTASAPTQSVGAGATASLILAPDQTFFGLSASVTMANAHLWHCAMTAETPEEVQ